MTYTLAEAAAACGLDKSTVRRAVRSGRISGTRDDLGVWHVEPAELHRVFPPADNTADAPLTAPRDTPSETAAFTTEVLIAELRTMLADVRQDRDHWREQAQRLALPMPTKTATVEKPTHWWRRWILC